jgi:hypothetical protein
MKCARQTWKWIFIMLKYVNINMKKTWYGYGVRSCLKLMLNKLKEMKGPTSIYTTFVTTPLLEECEDDTHTPEMGTWESSGTPEILEFDCRGQNTSLWGVLHVIGKLLKCTCRKWPRMSHLDICSTSYGKKKGRESNWQFDSRPLKVKNRPDPNVCR